MEFRNIYEQNYYNDTKVKIEAWIEKSLNQDVKEFYSIANSVKYNMDNILNFFVNRNANSESFNSKIKLFRANLSRSKRYYVFPI